MPPVSTDDNPFLQPGFGELPQPVIGGCWVREPEGTLVPDPAEPRPPGLPPADPQPE